jgi:ATP-dependent Clp protease ATP-binding subunit ClpA
VCEEAVFTPCVRSREDDEGSERRGEKWVFEQRGPQVSYRFSERARRAVGRAHAEAYERDNDSIGTGHLLLGLIRDSDDALSKTLTALGADRQEIRRRVEQAIGPVPIVRPEAHHVSFTPQAKKALERGLHEAQMRGHDLVDAEHILIGLSQQPTSTAAQILVALGAGPTRICQQMSLVWSAPSPDG